MSFHDAEAQTAVQSALGRALAAFHTPNDDPSVNTYADAHFLRTRLYNTHGRIFLLGAAGEQEETTSSVRYPTGEELTKNVRSG